MSSSNSESASSDTPSQSLPQSIDALKTGAAATAVPVSFIARDYTCEQCGETHQQIIAGWVRGGGQRRFCPGCTKIRSREQNRAYNQRQLINGKRKIVWTDERKQEVARLKHDGMSALRIAKHLGATRNAVIGIWNRMGLSNPRGKPSAADLEARYQRKLERQRERYQADPTPHRESQKRYYEANRDKYRVWNQNRKRQPSRPLTDAERLNVALPEYPLSNNKPLIDTTGCRFMPGNDFLCCDQPLHGESSYCEHHHQLTHWTP